jgi:hypothetical protein
LVTHQAKAVPAAIATTTPRFHFFISFKIRKAEIKIKPEKKDQSGMGCSSIK